MIDNKPDQIPLKTAQDDLNTNYRVLARKYRPLDFLKLCRFLGDNFHDDDVMNDFLMMLVVESYSTSPFSPS